MHIRGEELRSILNPHMAFSLAFLEIAGRDLLHKFKNKTKQTTNKQTLKQIKG